VKKYFKIGEFLTGGTFFLQHTVALSHDASRCKEKLLLLEVSL
jgi:hypothetical protein